MESVGFLQARARRDGVPVIHIRFDGPVGHVTEVNTSGWKFVPEVGPLPGEIVVSKQSCDSFHRSELQGQLRTLGVERLYVTGCVTELCVDATTRTAAAQGFDVTVVSNAHSTPDASLPGGPTPQMRVMWFNHVMSRLRDPAYLVSVKEASEVVTVWADNSTIARVAPWNEDH